MGLNLCQKSSFQTVWGGSKFKERILRSFLVLSASCIILAPTSVGASVSDNLNTSLRRVVERVDSLLSSSNTVVNKAGDAKQQINYLVGNTDEIKKDAIDSSSNLANKISELEKAVNANFQSVSEGKKSLVSNLTDKGAVPADGNADGISSFAEINAAINSLYTDRYNDGISFADGRINEESASYKKGQENISGLKMFEKKFNVTLMHTGAGYLLDKGIQDYYSTETGWGHCSSYLDGIHAICGSRDITVDFGDIIKDSKVLYTEVGILKPSAGTTYSDIFRRGNYWCLSSDGYTSNLPTSSNSSSGFYRVDLNNNKYRLEFENMYQDSYIVDVLILYIPQSSS